MYSMCKCRIFHDHDHELYSHRLLLVVPRFALAPTFPLSPPLFLLYRLTARECYETYDLRLSSTTNTGQVHLNY